MRYSEGNRPEEKEIEMLIKDIFTPKNIVKGAIRLTSGATASYTVQKIVRTVIDFDELDQNEKVAVHVGSASIGYAVGEGVGNVADEYVDMVFEIKNSVREMKSENEPIIIEHDPNE